MIFCTCLSSFSLFDQYGLQCSGDIRNRMEYKTSDFHEKKHLNKIKSTKEKYIENITSWRKFFSTKFYVSIGLEVALRRDFEAKHLPQRRDVQANV